MSEQLTNFVTIDGDSLKGNVATLAFDIDITGKRHDSENENAPVFKLFANSPRGKKIDIGGIWERTNNEGNTYLALTISTGYCKWYANLGRWPGQDDKTLYSVIPNEYLNSERSRG